MFPAHILTFMSAKNKNLGLPEPETAEFLHIFFYTYEHLTFHTQLS